jgi:hypothetical protein
MNRKTKKKWKQRIYGYIFDMVKGEEQKTAAIIANEIEVFTMDLATQIGELEDTVIKQKNKIKRLEQEKVK